MFLFNLQDVVFRIWFKYLSLTGIAFPEDQAKQKTVFSGFQRNRYVYFFTERQQKYLTMYTYQ